MTHLTLQRCLHYIFFLLLISSTTFFATFRITESPPFWYDEGYFYQIAANLARVGDFVIQTSPGEFVKPLLISTGYPLLFPVSVVFRIFGEGVLQARLVMAFFILALISIAFFFSQRLFGFKIAALASALMASFPPLYGHGKSMLGEVPGLFFLSAFLFFIYRIEQTEYRKKTPYIFAGLAAGLCVATKPIFILLLPAVLFAVILARRRIIFEWKLLAFGAVSFLAPIIVWFIAQTGMHASLSEIFSYYANPYSVENIWSLIIKNALRFFTEASPAYFFFLFLVWFVSLVIRARGKHPITLAESVAFFYTALVIVAYLRVEGWYRYFFTANVVAFLFFPNALFIIARAISKKYARIARSFLVVPVLLIVLMLLMHFYKLQSDSFVARSYNDTGTAELTGYFKNFNSLKTIFVFDIPNAVPFLPHNQYYQAIFFERKTVGTIQPVLRGIPDTILVKDSAYKEKADIFGLYEARDLVRDIVLLERK